MKKIIGVFLTLTLLLACVLAAAPNAAAAKNSESRVIAIVFDNSGSMYDYGDQAWCRATYAMEVFASMLNEGDVLQIYPMHPITVGDKEYTMNSPLQITDAAQAATIRDIYTKDAGGTPIESINCAIEGLKSINKDKKYMIVLTDGGTFSKNGSGLTKDRTKKELDNLIQANAGQGMTVMYLGIGGEACVPNTPQSEVFIKNQAVNTADVLAMLTEMCNLIFGRDTLPKSRISGNSVEFDISMSKLIVFVQGNNISDLKLVPAGDSSIGDLVSSQQTKYSTKGAGDYKSVPDTSLQGMMVTYEDCDAGTYTLSYSGSATSIEVYYEPDADLEFIFTDSEGNNVDPNALYEGEYKVSFGMKDAKTGRLISSDLLGNPRYTGSYSINGEKVEIKHEGYNGEVPIDLKIGDTFEAELTVTYLSGYVISKDSSDFGWPNGGVKVTAKPLGEFAMSLNVPQDYIVIKELGEADELIVDLTIDGRKLTAEEFDCVTIEVDCGGIPYTLTPNKEKSQYIIKYEADDNISEGKYKINVSAHYSDEKGREANAEQSNEVKLSKMARWLKWLIFLILLILLIIIIVLILRIRVLPKYMHTNKKQSDMVYDMTPVTNTASFDAEIKKKSARCGVRYGGRRFGIVMDVKPGKESYLYKPQKRKSAEVKPTSVKKFGPAKITEIMIGSTKYVLDEESGKIVPAIPGIKPFLLTDGMTIKYTGTIKDAGIDKDFEVRSKLSFKKK